jgi:hypothetical protein
MISYGQILWSPILNSVDPVGEEDDVAQVSELMPSEEELEANFAAMAELISDVEIRGVQAEASLAGRAS